jgi:hypothetical protein
MTRADIRRIRRELDYERFLLWVEAALLGVAVFLIVVSVGREVGRAIGGN